MLQICHNRTDAKRFAQDHRLTAAPFHRSHQSFPLSDSKRIEVSALGEDSSPWHQTREPFGQQQLFAQSAYTRFLPSFSFLAFSPPPIRHAHTHSLFERLRLSEAIESVSLFRLWSVRGQVCRLLDRRVMMVLHNGFDWGTSGVIDGTCDWWRRY